MEKGGDKMGTTEAGSRNLRYAESPLFRSPGRKIFASPSPSHAAIVSNQLGRHKPPLRAMAQSVLQSVDSRSELKHGPSEDCIASSISNLAQRP